MPHQPRLIKDEKAAYKLDDAQKAEYVARLRQKLQDPEFRQIEGFPIGEDEDILALSDPPFYTACPNPFLPEIIKQWQKEREEIREELGLPVDGENGTYHREPFAADVSEGKSGTIYSAHTYHTKVPHRAIMRYILHYTDPGDIVFDGFCGTGMTGVAAQYCGNPKEVETLGYNLNGRKISNDSTEVGILGSRKVLLSDISPSASFIASNYNLLNDPSLLEVEGRKILEEVDKECSWMFETLHKRTNGPSRSQIGKINYVVWSDVFQCPECSNEMVFWDVAVQNTDHKIKDVFSCPNCQVLLNKRLLILTKNAVYDPFLNKVIREVRITSKSKNAPKLLVKLSLTKKTNQEQRSNKNVNNRISKMPRTSHHQGCG